MPEETGSRQSRSGSSGESSRQTTAATAAGKRSTTATAALKSRKPRRWQLAWERKVPTGTREPNAAYIKRLFDRAPNVTSAEWKTLLRASQFYGLPIDYPRPEFNEEARRESYNHRRYE